MSIDVNVIPFVDEGLGNSSYLVDLGDGRALVIDALRDPSVYLAEARRRGLEIAYVADTHLHADFVSGARELAHLGAVVVAPAEAELGFDHRPLRDEEELDLGGLVLRTIATPGHTPEHVAYALLDGSRPVALFSGGALIVGSVARTDLIAPAETEALARAAYHSARDRLGVLPDDLDVYPTHGAGSFCSAGGGDERVTTIGRERERNTVFHARDEDAFVASLVGALGTFPPYFLRLREVNRRGPAVYGSTPPALPMLGTAELAKRGAVVVDARPFESYAAGHVPGSLSIELRAVFATWLGWLVPDDVPLVFVLDPGQDRSAVVRECLKIGYERLAGALDIEDAGIELATIPVLAPGHVHGTIVDVRQRSELASGRIPRAVHAEVGAIASDPASLPAGPLTLHCGHGQRAATAASVLERAGRRDVAVMAGDPEDWSRATGVALAVAT